MKHVTSKLWACDRGVGVKRSQKAWRNYWEAFCMLRWANSATYLRRYGTWVIAYLMWARYWVKASAVDSGGGMSAACTAGPIIGYPLSRAMVGCIMHVKLILVREFVSFTEILISCQWLVTIGTKNKSSASFEALQYRQDLFAITHYHRPLREKHFPIAIHVVQKITIIDAQKIGKFAVWNLILYTGAIWRRREKFEYGCTTINHPV